MLYPLLTSSSRGRGARPPGASSLTRVAREIAAEAATSGISAADFDLLLPRPPWTAADLLRICKTSHKHDCPHPRHDLSALRVTHHRAADGCEDGHFWALTGG